MMLFGIFTAAGVTSTIYTDVDCTTISTSFTAPLDVCGGAYNYYNGVGSASMLSCGATGFGVKNSVVNEGFVTT